MTIYDTTPTSMRSRAHSYACRAAQLSRQASKAETRDECQRYIEASRLYRDAVRNLLYKADAVECQAMRGEEIYLSECIA